MNKHLPERADLEHLKGQAKALLQSLHVGDPEALARMLVAGPYRLAQAQLTIAREYGFPSWAKLKRHIEGYPNRREAFFAGIRAGDHDAVQKLLEGDPSLAAARDPNSFGCAPLTAAVDRDDRRMVDVLLDHGVDIDGRSDWWAGSFGALDSSGDEMSRYLIQRGATLTAHAAARLGMVDELKAILRKHPEAVHERGGDGQFPLHFSKTPEIVDLLLDAGAEIDARDIDHNSTAAQWRIENEPVCRRLLERGATPDIYLAIAMDDLDLMKKLLDEDPTAVDRRVSDFGDPQVQKAPGGNIYMYSIGDFRPDQLASNLGREEIYRYLFERATPKNQLLAACWKPEPDVARQVAAEHPGLVDSLKLSDRQVLAHAAWQRRTESVRLMAELGFDVNVQLEDKMVPIACASFHGFDDIIQALLPYRPKLDILNVYGGTPLGACLYGSIHGWRKDGNYPRSVELLLEAGSPQPSRVYGSAEVRAVLLRYGISE